MKVFLASDFRCSVYKGTYYLETRAYVIYERYAKAFGKLVLCSRFEEVNELTADLNRVNFIDGIVKINSLEKVLLGLYKKQMLDAMEQCDIIVGRQPSVIAFKAADYAKLLKKRYIAESMCDGFLPYWNHGFQRKIIAGYMHKKMQRVTWNADYAIYVTEKYLQNRYPCKNPSISASNVVIKDINKSILDSRIKKISIMDKRNISIMTSANVDEKSKGQHFVIQAMKILKDRGINVTYYLAGGGNQTYLKKVASELGIENKLVFMGRLLIEKIFKQLDEIDIYIQPSLQEGLPRAVIEAMSRACPCIGAKTAGIPELIDNECVCERASAKSIADILENMLNTGLEKYAFNNFEHSKKYLNEVLESRRNIYFEVIRSDIKNNK